MKIFQFFFILISAVLISSFSFSESDKIDVNNLNQERLEKLILKEVNAIRKRKRLPTLVLDSTLSLAASDHAKYLKKIKKLSHNQKSRSKKSPMKRTDFYGGSFASVGENVAFTYIGKDVKSANNKKKIVNVSTYSATAKHLFNLWYYSKPHLQNLKDKDYTKTSIRFSYDKKLKRIYAVQVFAS